MKRMSSRLCAAFVACGMFIASSGVAWAQEIDLTPVKAAPLEIKQEEPNSKTITELDSPAPPQAEGEAAEGDATAEAEGAQEGEAAAKDKKGKKDKKEKKAKKGKKEKKGKKAKQAAESSEG